MEKMRQLLHQYGVVVVIVCLLIIGATAWGAYRFVATNGWHPYGHDESVAGSGSSCQGEPKKVKVKLAEVADMSLAWLAVKEKLQSELGANADIALQKMKGKDGQVLVRVKVNGSDKTFRVDRQGGIREEKNPKVWSTMEEACGDHSAAVSAGGCSSGASGCAEGASSSCGSTVGGTPITD
ncbi:MAG: hypothetical protein NZ959_11825 [Armatimonadetes bacterium]|nr:hypothetical protein [Armatimonadota bacterium]MDW8122672.1 hypothetical protein [Armatimonadota bacterium]